MTFTCLGVQGMTGMTRRFATHAPLGIRGHVGFTVFATFQIPGYAEYGYLQLPGYVRYATLGKTRVRRACRVRDMFALCAGRSDMVLRSISGNIGYAPLRRTHRALDPNTVPGIYRTSWYLPYPDDLPT